MSAADVELPRTLKDCQKIIGELRVKMKALAKEQEFEQAAVVRDKILVFEKLLLSL